MEKQEQVKIILGSALLFTVITSLSSLPGRLGIIILQGGSLKAGIISFVKINILWIIAVIAIIIFLNMLIGKSNQTRNLNLLEDENIRLTVGVLIIVEGLISLSSTVPLYIANMQSMLKVSNSVGDVYKIMVNKFIIFYIGSVILILCQVFLGIYFIKFYKNKQY